MTQSMTLAPVATHGFFLDGRWIEDGDAVEIRAPYDGSVIARVMQGRHEHAEAAIASAVKAFGTTRRLPAFERQRVLRQISAAIATRKEEFATTLAQEAGKPIRGKAPPDAGALCAAFPSGQWRESRRLTFR
jgi:acyl-CoA reductase-like NAD-dependent aldehyde dehydrogenase